MQLSQTSSDKNQHVKIQKCNNNVISMYFKIIYIYTRAAQLFVKSLIQRDDLSCIGMK